MENIIDHRDNLLLEHLNFPFISQNCNSNQNCKDFTSSK